jgi:hypothetical protein
MSEYRLNGMLAAVGLVIAGVLMLFYNFELAGVNQPLVSFLLAGGLALAGMFFFSAFLAARRNWWRLLPAWTLLALAGMVLISSISDSSLNGALIFAGLAVAFAHIYLLDRREHWWAILPGGFLLVLGALGALSEQLSPPMLSGLLFVGTGAVFVLVYLAGGHRQWWALVPATALVLFGLFVFVQMVEAAVHLVRWWPLLLIATGLYVGWQAMRRPPLERLTIHATAGTLGNRRNISPEPEVSPATPGKLGDYRQPAPGATVEVLSEE